MKKRDCKNWHNFQFSRKLDEVDDDIKGTWRVLNSILHKFSAILAVTNDVRS